MDSLNTTNHIYKILEDEIISLKIAPGDTLTENGLCERFQVSRTPIRSVLQRLQENGFVNIIPHKTTTVTSINLDLATQLIYERVAVESMVFRDFIYMHSPTDLARAHFFLNQLQDFIDSLQDFSMIDYNACLNLDHQMHEVWFQATGKGYLWSRIIRPDPNYSRLMRLDAKGANNFPDVLNEHLALLHLVDTKEVDKIEGLMHLHLYGGISRLGSKLFSEEYKRYFQDT